MEDSCENGNEYSETIKCKKNFWFAEEQLTAQGKEDSGDSRNRMVK